MTQTTTNSRGNFMRVSKDLLEQLDFNKPYEVQLALTILYKAQGGYVAWGDTLVDTTPSLLIKMFGNYADINQRQQKNVVEALISLRDKGVISYKGETLKFKDEILIDAKNLIGLSESGKVYVELLIKDFNEIMQVEQVEDKKNSNGVQSLLLQTFLVVKARWNFKNIGKLNKIEDFSYEVFQDGGDKEVQELTGVFCSDTYDFIRTHKHYELEEVEAWCWEENLKLYISKLIEIGCLKAKSQKAKNNGTWKTVSFYYTPDIESEKIEAMIGQYMRRYRYATKEKDENNEIEATTSKKPVVKREIAPRRVRW
ncbi:MAG: hypothetical protein [Malazfec virus 1]